MKEVRGYKITIVEIGTDERFNGQDWEQGAGKLTPDNKNSYGYTPRITKTCSYEKTIYEQTVEKLDLSAVVYVVNNIGDNK